MGGAMALMHGKMGDESWDTLQPLRPFWKLNGCALTFNLKSRRRRVRLRLWSPLQRHAGTSTSLIQGMQIHCYVYV